MVGKPQGAGDRVRHPRQGAILVYELLNALLQFLEIEKATSCKHLIPQKLPKPEFHSRVPSGGQSAGGSGSPSPSDSSPQGFSASTDTVWREHSGQAGAVCIGRRNPTASMYRATLLKRIVRLPTTASTLSLN